MSLLIILVFLAIALLGMPLAFSLGIGAVAGLIYSDVDFNLLPSRMMNAVNAFPLMTIPFFILAGELMMKAGIMERLIDLANSVVGRVRGGLAHVTVLAGMGLSTVSGAAVADASALGSTMIPSLRKVYGLGFSSAVVAAAANLGPIIPPSGRDDRLRLHGGAHGVGWRHVHGRRDPGPDPGRRRCCSWSGTPP